MRIHNIKLWTCIVCGIEIKDLADGEFLSVDPEGDAYSDASGSDGEVTRNDTQEKRWKITLNLIQGGETNTKLQALLTAGKLAGNGADVAPTTIRNPLGTYSFVCPETYIMTPAGQKGAREAQNRTWVIRAIDPVVVGA